MLHFSLLGHLAVRLNLKIMVQIYDSIQLNQEIV